MQLQWIKQTLRILKRNEEIRTVIPPKTKRGKEAHIVETFKKDDAGLSVVLHVPFDAKKRDFKRTGEAWVNVVDALPKIPSKLYYSEPLRCYGKNFAKNICLHVRAVEHCIRHRPVSGITGTLLEPFRNNKGEHEFVVRNEEGEIVDRMPFFKGFIPYDPEVVAYVNKFIDTKKGTFKRRNKDKATPMEKKRKVHEVQRNKPSGKSTGKNKKVIQLTSSN
jgi:hypothetical protein